MLVLLPPSETKRPGGDPARPLDLGALSRPALGRSRRAVLARVAELSRDLRTAAAALGLGARNASEAALNREIRRGPTMPALERFDGVLYDALDALTLPPESRAWIDGHVAIASALFGLLAPDDRIPAYRLSAGTRLPGATLRSLWREALVRELAAEHRFLLDLRSEAYAALGPAPVSGEGASDSAFLRVVADDGGASRPLTHLNKSAKGRLLRVLAQTRPELSGVDDLLAWADAQGLRLRRGAPGELEFVVAQDQA